MYKCLNLYNFIYMNYYNIIYVYNMCLCVFFFLNKAQNTTDSPVFIWVLLQKKGSSFQGAIHKFEE